jgi:fructosamine-3-kinase
MINRNYIELYKIVLARWVNKALTKHSHEKNIISRFKSTWIWPLDPKAMDERLKLNNLYTIMNHIIKQQDDDY